jgi:hypothetical protein
MRSSAARARRQRYFAHAARGLARAVDVDDAASAIEVGAFERRPLLRPQPGRRGERDERAVGRAEFGVERAELGRA